MYIERILIYIYINYIYIYIYTHTYEGSLQLPLWWLDCPWFFPLGDLDMGWWFMYSRDLVIRTVVVHQHC